MQYDLEVHLVDNHGIIRLDKHQGMFTVAVVDVHKQPVRQLAPDNFLLSCDAEAIERIHTVECDPGIYAVEFYFERRCLTTLQNEDKIGTPLEVTLTVKKNDRISNNHLIVMFRPRQANHVIEHAINVYDEIDSVEDALAVFQQHTADAHGTITWAGIYLHWQHRYILAVSNAPLKIPPHPYQDAVLFLEYRNQMWQRPLEP